jgi:excisionase family DNA binding protein
MQNITEKNSALDNYFKTMMKEALREELSEKQNQDKLPKPEEFLTITQAAELIGLKKPTIYSKTSQKEIPHFKRGKKLYFKRSELEQWLISGRVLTNTELDSIAERITVKNSKGGKR